MSMPRITGSGFEKAAIGAAVLVGAVIVYKLYGVVSAGVQAVGQVTTATGEAVGGAVYTALNGDAFAQTQDVVQEEQAALKAAGYPPVGSDQYNEILAQYQSG